MCSALVKAHIRFKAAVLPIQHLFHTTASHAEDVFRSIVIGVLDDDLEMIRTLLDKEYNMSILLLT
jgi:hypothetical protein